jgi:CDP-diacylglycerol--glycerol-3-phosphate 3-phosphatidyltransferase
MHSLLGACAAFSYRLESPHVVRWQHPYPAPVDDPSAFRQHAGEVLNSFSRSWSSRPPRELSSHSGPPHHLDTSLRPFLQMGPFGVRQESDLVVPAVIRAANEMATSPGGIRTTIDWTSGYFSLEDEYKRRLLDSRAHVRVVCASPDANGFLNSRGVSKYIPPAYTYLERDFWEAVREKGKEERIELREWRRKGWTYHAKGELRAFGGPLSDRFAHYRLGATKGIWLSPASKSPLAHLPASTCQPVPADVWFADPPPPPDGSTSSDPVVSLVGSSNYGPRSATRDLEINLLVVTSNAGLRGRMREELRRIREPTEFVDASVFERKDRKVKWGVKVAARAIRDML